MNRRAKRWEEEKQQMVRERHSLEVKKVLFRGPITKVREPLKSTSRNAGGKNNSWFRIWKGHTTITKVLRFLGRANNENR